MVVATFSASAATASQLSRSTSEEKPKRIAHSAASSVSAPPRSTETRRLTPFSIIGVEILKNLRRDGDEWRGDIYDPVHGKTYRTVVQRDGRDTLEVKGCVTIFCKTQTWDRMD
jgi:uncharacterized protein (DUF2147 family)